jgi:hypothetical protein
MNVYSAQTLSKVRLIVEGFQSDIFVYRFVVCSDTTYLKIVGKRLISNTKIIYYKTTPRYLTI